MGAPRDDNYNFDSLERKINASLDTVQAQVDALSENISSLSNTVSNITPVSYAEIVNLIGNSSFEWSKDAYTMLGISGATVTDGRPRSL